MFFCYAQKNIIIAQNKSSDALSYDVLEKFGAVAYELSLAAVKEEYEGEDVDGKALQREARKEANVATSDCIGAFLLSGAETKRVMTENFDDNKNKTDIIKCIVELSKLNIKHPLLIRYVIKHYRDFFGLELEFSARLLKEYLKQRK
jgi:hypothetical protein